MLARFQIIREVGRGGTGVVYEAYDRLLGARIALKRIVGASPASIARLRRTLNVAAHLYQENVVALGELLRARDDWFLSMELVEGTDLLRWVRGDRGPGVPPDDGRLRLALVQIAQALVALHATGIVHRDVKPSNVIAARDGRLVLVDMGLATEVGPPVALLPPGSIGTPAYMAPEQATTTYASPALDWYAYGVLLYQSLTGALPFEGGGFAALLAKRTRPPAPLRALVHDVPQDLAELAMQLLARDPDARPSGAEVLTRLEAPIRTPLARHRPPFIGRAPALMTLFGQLERAAGGERVFCRVVGPWGCGRGALLRRFGELVTQRGHDAWVIQAAGSRRERMRLALVDSILEAAGAAEDVVDDGEGHAPEAWAALLAAALRSRANGRVVVLVVQNADWLDRESQLVLAKLASSAVVGPMLVVCSVESRRWLQSVGCGRVDVPVGPLSKEESVELAKLLLASSGAPRSMFSEAAPRIAAQSGGRPGLIEELALAAMRDGGDPLEERVGGLSDPALRLAAASGRPLRESGVGPADILPGLHELDAAHLGRLCVHKRDTLTVARPAVSRAARKILGHIAP